MSDDSREEDGKYIFTVNGQSRCIDINSPHLMYYNKAKTHGKSPIGSSIASAELNDLWLDFTKANKEYNESRKELAESLTIGGLELVPQIGDVDEYGIDRNKFPTLDLSTFTFESPTEPESAFMKHYKEKAGVVSTWNAKNYDDLSAIDFRNAPYERGSNQGYECDNDNHTIGCQCRGYTKGNPSGNWPDSIIGVDCEEEPEITERGLSVDDFYYNPVRDNNDEWNYGRHASGGGAIAHNVFYANLKRNSHRKP